LISRGVSRVDSATARKSAFLVATVLLCFASWNVYRDRPRVGMILGLAGVILVVIGLCFPAVARRFHIGWMQFAAVLGHINSRILLSLMYYGVITPFGIAGRIGGRNPLNRRGGTRPTYWVPRKLGRQTREGFERSF
jgi:hypothetical protein